MARGVGALGPEPAPLSPSQACLPSIGASDARQERRRSVTSNPPSASRSPARTARPTAASPGRGGPLRPGAVPGRRRSRGPMRKSCSAVASKITVDRLELAATAARHGGDEVEDACPAVAGGVDEHEPAAHRPGQGTPPVTHGRRTPRRRRRRPRSRPRSRVLATTLGVTAVTGGDCALHGLSLRADRASGRSPWSASRRPALAVAGAVLLRGLVSAHEPSGLTFGRRPHSRAFARSLTTQPPRPRLPPAALDGSSRSRRDARRFTH